MRQFDVRIETRQCDLIKTEEVYDLINHVEAADMFPDMLLNVAGIDHEGGFVKHDLEKLLGIVRVNIEATLSLTHAVLSRHRGIKSYI